MKMTRSTTPLRCTSSHYLPSKAKVEFLHRRAFALPSHLRPISANGFLQGDAILALHPSVQLVRSKSLHLVHVRAAAKGSKGSKPPPKPASRGIVLAAIFLPLALAASAVAVGQILLAKIQKDAREEAEEWERRFDPSRLLPDGKTDEERKLERESTAAAESANVPSTRNRPKREE